MCIYIYYTYDLTHIHISQYMYVHVYVVLYISTHIYIRQAILPSLPFVKCGRKYNLIHSKRAYAAQDRCH